MTTYAAIDNGADVLDSRDIDQRIAELEGSEDADEQAELAALVAFKAEAEGYCADWQFGETLIRDSYFETYAQELAHDLGLINREVSWPFTCIDWAQATRELQQDYTSAEFDGVTYWFR